MSRVLTLIVAAAIATACASRPRGPGDELSPTPPTDGQEPIQQVPAEPGGPATPFPDTPAPDDDDEEPTPEEAAEDAMEGEVPETSSGMP